jgi:RNA polymerase primary sigma factor
MRNKLKSRPASKSRPEATASPRPTKITASSEMLRRAAGLLTKDIRFISADEFEDLDGDSTPITDVLTLIESLQSRQECDGYRACSFGGIDLDNIPVGRDWHSDASLLSFEQEQLLFRAMNLLKFRAGRVRSRLSPSAPSKKAMDQIDEMLMIVEKIRCQLVNSNLRLVHSIARKFSSQHSVFDDLTSDGCMILLGAIDRFDYSRGFRFSTYATHSIKRHFYRVWKMRQQQKDRFPNTASEILSEIPNATADEHVWDNPELVVSTLLASAESILDAREQQIILSRYGLKSSTSVGHTLREIAAEMGLSKEGVRQLQLKALEKLRDLVPPELMLSGS